MADVAMTAPIASRTLAYKRADGENVQIEVILGMPVPDPHEPERAWVCPFQITGFAKPVTRAMYGIDAMQALILALHTLPTELRALSTDEGGGFLEAADLGLDHACHVHLKYAG